MDDKVKRIHDYSITLLSIVDINITANTLHTCWHCVDKIKFGLQIRKL